MKYFLPFNKNGKIELTEKALKEILADSYREGYVQGEIDCILHNAPDFSLEDSKVNNKEKEFSDNGKTIVFRATVI